MIKRAGPLNNVSVKKPSLLTYQEWYNHLLTLRPWEKHTHSEWLLLNGLKTFLCFLMTAVTRITVGKDGCTQNVQHLLRFSFSSTRSLSSTPKCPWDVQLSASDKSAATNTELKETSHRNLNTFTSFNEWIDLKEQKNVLREARQGTTFAGKEASQKFHWAAVSEQPYSDMHSAITIQYPSPSSTFLQSSTIDKMNSASSPKSPQVTLLYFPFQPQHSLTGKSSSFLQPFQLHKPAAHPINPQNKFPNNGMQLLSAFHPSPGSVLHPWRINFHRGSHCRLFTHINRQNPPCEPFLMLQLDLTVPAFPITGTSISSSLAHHLRLTGLGHRGNDLLLLSKNPKNMWCRKSSHH